MSGILAWQTLVVGGSLGYVIMVERVINLDTPLDGRGAGRGLGGPVKGQP